MQLSIIIVNYKSPQLVLNCLQSIYAETKQISFEVIVVDNASGDNSREVILPEYPSVKWIDMTYNSGFARGNNEGIRQSQSPVVLLLNADTIVEKNAIENTYLEFMNSDGAACGLQLLNSDGTPQISGNYAMSGGLNYLLPLPYLGNVVKWLGQLFKVNKPNLPVAIGKVEVDWINGAFLMVKKSAIDKVGLMDEDFFLFSEEAEWCSRLKKVGKLYIFGNQHIIHLQGETTNEVLQTSGKGYYDLYSRKGRQIMISNFVRIRKQFGVFWFLLIFLIYFLGILFFPLGVLVEKIFTLNHSTFHWLQVKGYIVNMFKAMSLLTHIVRNRPYFYKVI